MNPFILQARLVPSEVPAARPLRFPVSPRVTCLSLFSTCCLHKTSGSKPGSWFTAGSSQILEMWLAGPYASREALTSLSGRRSIPEPCSRARFSLPPIRGLSWTWESAWPTGLFLAAGWASQSEHPERISVCHTLGAGAWSHKQPARALAVQRAEWASLLTQLQPICDTGWDAVR